ncbi:hypothetical protein A6J66_019810 [Yersinia enterocolitica]|nr:hypothetical protein A6J66_019810 [Yersinia enterocolitica]
MWSRQPCIGCLCNIPVILQAACALATFITRITYSCKLIGFSRLPPSCNSNYLGYKKCSEI